LSGGLIASTLICRSLIGGALICSSLAIGSLSSLTCLTSSCLRLTSAGLCIACIRLSGTWLRCSAAGQDRDRIDNDDTAGGESGFGKSRILIDWRDDTATLFHDFSVDRNRAWNRTSQAKLSSFIRRQH